MTFEVTILGANSAIPAYNRYPSAQVLNVHQSLYLIDCGEGTQMRLTQFRVKRSKINHIFISHLHGDHFLGLPGLLNTYNLNGRKDPLHVYGPPGLQDVIETIFEYGRSYANYDLIFKELQPNQLQHIADDNEVKVYAFPLYHGVPTIGYLFREKNQKPNIDSSAIQKFDLTVDQIKRAKSRKNIIVDGQEMDYSKVTLPIKPSRSYAYCSDTLYDERLIHHIKNVSMLYHEATYLDNMAHQAKERMHTTAKEAAIMARKCNAEKLIIGHFSSRYKDLSPLLEEAKSEFYETELAVEGRVYKMV